MRLELTNIGFAIRCLSRLATRAMKLERKERFELSSRVWKTRMFPATSLPRMRRPGGPRFDCGVRTFGAPGRTWTRSLDVRSVALFHLSYRSENVWPGWTELNCHHEFPKLGCLRYTTPRFLTWCSETGETRIFPCHRVSVSPHRHYWRN